MTQIYNLTSNLSEKWKLHAPPLIPNLIAAYDPASQRGYMKFEF